MNEQSELKQRAEELIELERVSPCDSKRVMLIGPETVLALIVELDDARSGMKHSCAIRLKKQIEQLETERDRLKAENEELCAKVANLNVSGFAEAFYTVAAELGIIGARPVSPMQMFASEVLPTLQSAIQDAERYRWIRDKSEAVHQFYLSVPLWFTGVRFRAQDVDKAIDAMSKGEQP